MADDSSLAAVRRKLNVTWEDVATEARIADVVASVSPSLSARLGYPADHAYTVADGQAWALFLNACLYEWSDALDDFWDNFAEELSATRLVVTLQDGGADGS
jgi:hypothetical protein